jgi:hypothetical protein
MVTRTRNGLTRGRTKIAVALAITILVLAMGGTAFGLLTAGSGGPITRVLVRSSTGFVSTSSSTFVDVLYASRTLTVPAEQKALVTARFTAESECSGTNGSWCTARIMAGTTQMNPPSGNDFAFDSPSSVGTDNREGNAMERDIILSAGTYVIKVQYAIVGTATFGVDDWHLTIESSKI